MQKSVFLFKMLDMNLYIDTSKNEYFQLALKDEGQLIDQIKVEAKFKQSEKLLLSIDKLLAKNKTNIKQLEKLIVEDVGEGFSALRIGVVTANALAYGLGIPCETVNGEEIKTAKFNLVKPKYNQEPNIG